MLKKNVFIETMILIVLSFVGLTACTTPLTPDKYSRCLPIKDLVEQHRCLMVAAIETSDYVRMEQLFKTGYISINGPQEAHRRSYLEHAAYYFASHPRIQMDSNVFIVLFELGADINQSYAPILDIVRSEQFRKDELGARTIVHVFVRNGLDGNVVVASPKSKYVTNLLGHIATGCGKAETKPTTNRSLLVSDLISSGADANYRNTEGVNALHLIAAMPSSQPAEPVHQCDQIVRRLVAAGADMSARTRSNLTPIDYTMVGPRKLDNRGDPRTCTTIPAYMYEWSNEQRSQASIRQTLLDLGSPQATLQGDKIPCPELRVF